MAVLSQAEVLQLRNRIASHMPLLTAADCCDRNGRELGEREALIDRRYRLNWGQVSGLSDRLALAFQDNGLKRASRILVQLPNCVELFLIRLAAEKAGLRLITVAPAFRSAELAAIVQFTKPVAAIVPSVYRGFNYLEALGKNHNPEMQYIWVTGENVPSGCTAFDELLTRRSPDARDMERLRKVRHSVLDLCQIGTTSGTTGIPKCVDVPLYTRLLTGWIQLKRFGITATDTLAAVTSMISGTADAVVYQGGCQLGAPIVLMDHFSPEETYATLQTERVNVIPLVPTMIIRMAGLKNHPNSKSSLRLIINHASNLSYSQALEAEERLQCRIVQAFGTVDCGGISATCWADEPEVRLATVGRPLDGNTIRIVDGNGNEVPPGTVGRLLVQGLHTEARFFDNPKLNENLRRTGYFDTRELVRMDPKGNLVLMGREQDLIIRGGQNIYPANVESSMLEHPKILEACVVGMPDAELGERVCGFVVCPEGESVSLAELTSLLEKRGLARFKWPERLEVLSALPRGAGHKIDRKKLKKGLLTSPKQS